MRAFIGLEIPENIRTFYASSCKSLHKSAEMSFMRLDKMHITLAFFPDLPETYIKNIEDILKDLNREQFEIKCENIGLFKRKGIPSTIFIKIISDDLTAYKEQLYQKLKELHIPFDDRKPYTPHITLGRIKEVKNEQDFTRSYRYIAQNFKSSSFMVDSIHLYSSDMINYKIEASEDFIKIYSEENEDENISEN